MSELWLLFLLGVVDQLAVDHKLRTLWTKSTWLTEEGRVEEWRGGLGVALRVAEGRQRCQDPFQLLIVQKRVLTPFPPP
jgi:hypothetical protein